MIGVASAVLGIYITVWPLESPITKVAVAIAFVALIGAVAVAGSRQKDRAASEAERARQEERSWRENANQKLDTLQDKKTFTFVDGKNARNLTVLHNTAVVMGGSAPPAAGHDRRATIVNEVVRVADLALDGVYLRYRSFENCRIVGPALFLVVPGVTDGVEISGCHPVALHKKSVVWSVPEPAQVIGAIALDQVTFHKCHFENVAFATVADSVDSLRDGLTGGSDSAE